MNEVFPAMVSSRLPLLRNRNELALFLDFDGTLVEFADHPDAVMLDPETHDCLARLYERLDGALAIITGRDITSVDGFLTLPLLPVAGVHGLIRRDASGHVHELSVNYGFLTGLGKDLDAFAAQHEGLLVERKPGALALHYRLRPDLAAACSSLIDRLTESAAGITVLRGKSVIEARANGADKGSAIVAFMQEAPFAGRRAVFAGDDVTDEDGFARVNRLDGITIKVGGGPTCARYRVPGIADFRRWLCETAWRFDRQERE